MSHPFPVPKSIEAEVERLTSRMEKPSFNWKLAWFGPCLPDTPVLKDIRLGMPYAKLMRKYRLTTRGLQSLFKKLLDTGCIEQFEFDQRLVMFEGTVDLHQVLDELALGQQDRLSTAAAESDHEPQTEKQGKG